MKLNVSLPDEDVAFLDEYAREQGGLARDCKGQAEQVRAVSVDRVSVRMGRVPPALMADLDEALRLHLALRSDQPGGVIPRWRRARRAAWWPDMPWTPAPGGVDDEQRKTPSRGVA